MGVHRVLDGHADVARAALAGIPTGPNAARLAKFVFGLLVGAGMAPKDASYTLDRLTLHVSGEAYEGSLHHAKMRAAGLTDPAGYFRRFVGEVAACFHSLPAERFPYVDALTGRDGEERFRYGFGLFIAGVAARAP